MAVLQNMDAGRKTGANGAVWFALVAGAVWSWASAGSIGVRLVDAQGKPVIGAVVTIQEAEVARPPAPAIDTVMDQIGLNFMPGLIVVPVGSRVAFPNSDAVSHQVYSFSPAKKFQLPLYRGKPYPPQVFDAPGVITVGCNIHDDMLGHIIVTDAPYYGVTMSDGSFNKTSLPLGRYEIKVWQPQLRDMSKPWTSKLEIRSADDRHMLELKIAAVARNDKSTAAKRGWDSY
jgi:plastocyanin